LAKEPGLKPPVVFSYASGPDFPLVSAPRENNPIAMHNAAKTSLPIPLLINPV
jgi:hypothetical protein